MTAARGADIFSGCATPYAKGRHTLVDADPGRLALSELESITVLDAAGRDLGELLDVLAAPALEPPTVTGCIVGRDDEQLRASWDQIAEIDVDGRRLLLGVSAAELAPASLSGDEIALVDAVLDNQVLDVERRKFVRVQDVLLDVGDDSLVVAGIDASSGAVMRRIGLGFLSRRLAARPGDFVPWDAVNLISVRLSRANFVDAFAEIAELHPADLADVIGQVGPRQRAAVLAALAEPLAADTLEEMDDELASAALVEMPRERAAAVLGHIEPDDAADLLADLPKRRATRLLSLMDRERAAEIRELLTYPENSAGGIMTTEYAMVPPEVTAAEAIELLRDQEPEVETVYYIYVTDKREHLLGTISLRDLLTVPGSRRVRDFMTADPISVTLAAGEEEVTQTIAKYNLLALPVVDAGGVLHGIVTIDDAIDLVLPLAWKKRLPRIFR